MQGLAKSLLASPSLQVSPLSAKERTVGMTQMHGCICRKDPQSKKTLMGRLPPGIEISSPRDLDVVSIELAEARGARAGCFVELISQAFIHCPL